ncbi:CsgG/HfaB family protein [Sulfurimonas sp.]|uniref:CsgG/HfaB family protein n=1 Tax=Sulfurimonas sp. TaxID=2022749 RepID=UPI003D0B1B52
MKKSFLVAILIVLTFTSCAQRVGIKALEPAEVDRISQTKKITVTYFDNDRVGLSDKVEAKLAGFQLDNKKYFTIVSRKDFDNIISEQKLQNSGLVDPKDAVKIGNIIGAQAIISGHVSSPSIQDSRFYEQRVRCANSKCTELSYYNVSCMKRVSSLSADIRVIDVTKGDVIYADTLTRSSTDKHCIDDSRVLPSREMAGQYLANAIADSFTYKLTPHYKQFDVALLEKPDIDYTDRDEQLLKVSLTYIEQGRYDKAEKLLMDLVDATAQKSYVPFYNLGVIKEAQGNYDEAKEYYGYADNLMIEPVEEINNAVVRIESLIEKRKRTMEQINR